MHFGQVANFKTNSNIPIEKIPMAINTYLKKSIRIQKAEEVDERFHSRFNCKQKTYRYIINNSEHGTAIYRSMEYCFPGKLNIEAMKKASKYFEGEHDFKAFKARICSLISSRSRIVASSKSSISSKSRTCFFSSIKTSTPYRATRL